eukprot:gene3573-3912_t
MIFPANLYLLFISFFSVGWVALSTPKIAVCICGQLGRLIVNSTFVHLLQPNPSINFTIFYHLQRSYIHNTGHTMKPSPYLNFSEQDLRRELEQVYLPTTPHVSLGSILFNHHVTHDEWRTRLNMHKLARIYQRPLLPFQHLILEMYKHHVDCANEIISYEDSSAPFDFVLLLREDLFFFHSLHMQPLLSRMSPATSQEKYFSFQRSNESSIYSSELYQNLMAASTSNLSLDNVSGALSSAASESCHVMSKDCLRWGGLNIRFELFTRVAGLSLLQSRISFYKYLEATNSKIYNPERFDLIQMDRLGYKACFAGTTDIPLTVARYNNESFCFNWVELWYGKDFCYPTSNDSFVSGHLCQPPP